jgi:hypothetical protein
MSSLIRSLTQHKLDFAHSMIDKLDNPRGKFLIEMGIVMEKDVVWSDISRKNYKWLVHYYDVHVDGERELCQEYINGTCEQVLALFPQSLLMRSKVM